MLSRNILFASRVLVVLSRPRPMEWEVWYGECLPADTAISGALYHHNIVLTVHCTVYTVHCTLFSVHLTGYI